MKILAIDPADVTGWAHSSGPHGVWQLVASGSEPSGKRLLRLEDRLFEMHKSLGVEKVVFEHAAMGSHNHVAIQAHAKKAGVIEKFAAAAGVPWAVVNPLTVKKFATGNGHATKTDMIRALFQQFGIKVASDDEADAIWILKFADHAMDIEKKIRAARHDSTRETQGSLLR